MTMSYYDISHDPHLREVVERDLKGEFISILAEERDKFMNSSQAILSFVCQHKAIHCAEALITGETCLTVDVNLPSWPETQMYPIHQVAYELCDCPAMIEFLLYHGARTDIRYNPTSKADLIIEKSVNKLPLQIALQQIDLGSFYSPEWSNWNPKHSIYKLIAILCLPRLQNHLETIALLAGTTKEIGEVCLEYAMEGKVIELACLLIAAMATHYKLDGAKARIRPCLDSIEKNPSLVMEEEQRENLVSVGLLIDRVHNFVSLLVRRHTPEVDKFQIIKKIKGFFKRFLVSESEFDLDDDWWYESWCKRQKLIEDNNGTMLPCEKERCLFDFGMAHYGKSGYRWTVENYDPWIPCSNRWVYINDLENEINSLKEKNAMVIRKQRMEKVELWSVLEKDDKEKLASLVDRNFPWFCSGKQQLLHAICFFRSIKCAEAILKEDISLRVDLNVPCSYTGLYPLHYAALSFSPSITELFLHHGAKTDVRSRPMNRSESTLQHLSNRLPLEMAIHGISHLPCMREWTSEDSISNLVTLLCLPRMQNPLETLTLLAMTTKETEDVFTQLLAYDEIVEVAALLTVGYRKFSKAIENDLMETHKRCDSHDPSLFDEFEWEDVGAKHDLHRLFNDHGCDISAYVKEDKHNVSKYQVVEDLKDLLPTSLPDPDLSIYNWYREEESSYPSEAPYEDVRQLNDISMEHYGKSTFRWRSSGRKFRWMNSGERIKAYEDDLKEEIRRLKSMHSKAYDDLDQMRMNEVPSMAYLLRQQFPTDDSAKGGSTMCRASINLKQISPRKAMPLMASSFNVQYLSPRRSMKPMPSLSRLPYHDAPFLRVCGISR